jgi:hypothetical protein
MMASRAGIIITEKLLSHALPADYMGYPMVSVDDDAHVDLRGQTAQVSARETLIRWLKRQNPQAAMTLFDDAEPLALQPALKLVEETGATFLSHALYVMARITTRHCDSMFPDSVPFFLRTSRSLYRHLHDQLRVLKSAARLAPLRGGVGLAQQVQDIDSLRDDMEKAVSALKEDVRFLVAAATIREGIIVGRVTKFAFLFAPLSLLAAVLAIQDESYLRIKIFGGLGGGFLVISGLVLFWKPSHLDRLRL